MSGDLQFFLDFMSPFAYLAHQRLPSLARRYGRGITYCPIDLPAAKRAAGNSGPPNVKIPVKLRYLMTDMDRWARRYGVPLKFPVSLDSGLMNKGLFYAIDRAQAESYAGVAWRRSWGEGGDMGDPALLQEVAAELNWDTGEFLGFLHSEEAEARYDAGNRRAQELGVFGVPTIRIGDQMWWGNDRLDFLEEYLAQPDLKFAIQEKVL